jgi:uncharacterized membrane protein YeaQ/YmgE (transglycosylase-associated protein family)
VIWNLLGAFVGYAVIDYVFVHWTLATVNDKWFTSGVTSAILVAVQGAVILLYVNNPWSIAAASAGAFAGTVIAMKGRK